MNCKHSPPPPSTIGDKCKTVAGSRTKPSLFVELVIYIYVCSKYEKN